MIPMSTTAPVPTVPTMPTMPTMPTVPGPEPTASPPEPDDGVLRLRSVLVSGLPAALGTDAAPERYTVPAVFSRQVTQTERARIEDPAAARSLAHASPGLELAVSDRRLLIHGTNLAELRDGLAADLAGLLRSIAAQIHDEDDRREAVRADVRRTEVERSSVVSAAAAEIHFD